MKYEVGETYNLRWSRPEGFPTVGQAVYWGHSCEFFVVRITNQLSTELFGKKLFTCDLFCECLKCDLDVFSQKTIDDGLLFVGPINRDSAWWDHRV